jgi:hypothetical protein
VVGDAQNPDTIGAHLVGQVIEILQYPAIQADGPQYLVASAADSLRGVAGGLMADFYNWQDPLGILDPTRLGPEGQVEDLGSTLDFLRLAAEHGAEPVLTVNTRGFRQRFMNPISRNNPYTTRDIDTLAALAAEWVIYVNYTLQHHSTTERPDRGSDIPLELKSASILNQLVWQNTNGRGLREPLPSPGETLPQVTYWEIGNEPNFGLGGFVLPPEEFAARYVRISTEMLIADLAINGKKTIRVGPSLMNNHPPQEDTITEYLNALQAADAVVDFIAYHPYTQIFGPWTLAPDDTWHTQLPDSADQFTPENLAYVEKQISSIYQAQATFLQNVSIDAFPGLTFLASEWNPASWQSSFYLTWRGKSMAQSLAVMETIFSFARLGVEAAHYHTNPVFVGSDTEHPTYQTFSFLKEWLGDELLGVEAGPDPDAATFRAYITRHASGSPLAGHLVLWAMNWGDAPEVFTFEIPDPGVSYRLAETCLLAAPSLLHGARRDPGAPRVDPTPAGSVSLECLPILPGSPEDQRWVGSINLTLEVPAAAWSAVVLQPLGPPGSP